MFIRPGSTARSRHSGESRNPLLSLRQNCAGRSPGDIWRRSLNGCRLGRRHGGISCCGSFADAGKFLTGLVLRPEAVIPAKAGIHY